MSKSPTKIKTRTRVAANDDYVHRRRFDRTPLDEVDEIIGARSVIGEAERTAVVLWIAHTYCYSTGFAYPSRRYLGLHPPLGERPPCRVPPLG